MLQVLDLYSGAALSCSLTRASVVSQVVDALRRRKSSPSPEDASLLCALYSAWYDSKQRLHAKRLKSDDRPLVLVEHLRRTTGQDPQFKLEGRYVSARLLLATIPHEDEAQFFADKHIILDSSSDAEFIHILQRLGPDDVCGNLLTNVIDVVTGRTFTVDMWWVLMGEKLWFQSSYEDDNRTVVSLARNKVNGPWGSEFELETALQGYRLIAPNPKDAQLWVKTLKVRIELATENERIYNADLLISEEERATWTATNALLDNLESGDIDTWCQSGVALRQLSTFARMDGSEYLLLFYADCSSALRADNAASHAPTFVRRFLNLANLPESLLPMKAELNALVTGNTANEITPLTLKRLHNEVRIELESGLLARLRDKPLIYDRLVCDIPLYVERELL